MNTVQTAGESEQSLVAAEVALGEVVSSSNGMQLMKAYGDSGSFPSANNETKLASTEVVDVCGLKGHSLALQEVTVARDSNIQVAETDGGTFFNGKKRAMLNSTKKLKLFGLKQKSVAKVTRDVVVKATISSNAGSTDTTVSNGDKKAKLDFTNSTSQKLSTSNSVRKERKRKKMPAVRLVEDICR